jgi:hypothetical protein
MEIRQTFSQLHSGFWFSYFGQGYYFSVGYFALPKPNIAAIEGISPIII